MNNFLETIRHSVQTRVESLCATSDFMTLFSQREPAIIAEIKFASPSKGQIYPGAKDHLAIAADYLANGAAALSVLTEPYFFKGHINFLSEIREHYPQALLLLKDFVFDPIQIVQAKMAGANAILLIATFLDDQQLQDLYDCALGYNLTPLVEISNHHELEGALQLQPKLIGINHRNLHSLSLDFTVSQELIQLIPEEVHVIAESGLQNGGQVKALQALGFDGFLIGTSFMQHAHPGQVLGQLLHEARNEG